MFLFFVSVLTVATAALLQTTEAIAFGPIKPNLVLILIVILSSIYKDWSYRFILVLTGATILKFSELFQLSDLVLIAALLLSIVIIDYLPWRKLINIELAVILGTLILNLVVFTPTTLILETLTNVILTVAIFIIAHIIYEEEIKSQENRF